MGREKGDVWAGCGSRVQKKEVGKKGKGGSAGLHIFIITARNLEKAQEESDSGAPCEEKKKNRLDRFLRRDRRKKEWSLSRATGGPVSTKKEPKKKEESCSLKKEIWRTKVAKSRGKVGPK